MSVFLSILLVAAGLAFVPLIVSLRRDAVAALHRAADAPVRPYPDIKPSRIRLVPRDELAWEDAAGADEQARQLLDLGYREAGRFEVEAKEGYRVWGFVKREDSVWAAVQELPGDGTAVEVATRFRDGGLLTLTNAEPAVPIARPPELATESHRGHGARELHRRMIEARAGRDVAPASPDEFPERYEAAWAARMDWWNFRGGFSEDELLALGASRGEAWDDGKIAAHRENEVSHALAGLYESLADRFFAGAEGLSVVERYRLKSSLVIIHDRIPIEAVAGAFRLSLEEADRRIAAASAKARMHDDFVDGLYPAPLAEWTARRAFAGLNATFPARRRYRKLAEVTEPIAADVYAPPGIRLRGGSRS